MFTVITVADLSPPNYNFTCTSFTKFRRLISIEFDLFCPETCNFICRYSIGSLVWPPVSCRILQRLCRSNSLHHERSSKNLIRTRSTSRNPRVKAHHRPCVSHTQQIQTCRVTYGCSVRYGTWRGRYVKSTGRYIECMV